MNISQKGMHIVKEHEGFRSKPYLCPAGVPTIGYGATYYPSGRKVTMSDRPISEQEGEEMLRDMLLRYEKGVNRYVQKPINQNQFDALVSFSYNLGLGALQRSTLLKKVNKNPNDLNIRDEFMKWVKAGGRTLRGLVKRRAEEADLYFN